MRGGRITSPDCNGGLVSWVAATEGGVGEAQLVGIKQPPHEASSLFLHGKGGLQGLNHKVLCPTELS